MHCPGFSFFAKGYIKKRTRIKQPKLNLVTVGRVVKVEDLVRFERFAPRGFDSLRISNAKIITKRERKCFTAGGAGHSTIDATLDSVGSHPS